MEKLEYPYLPILIFTFFFSWTTAPSPWAECPFLFAYRRTDTLVDWTQSWVTKWRSSREPGRCREAAWTIWSPKGLYLRSDFSIKLTWFYLTQILDWDNNHCCFKGVSDLETCIDYFALPGSPLLKCQARVAYSRPVDKIHISLQFRLSVIRGPCPI